jgi:hypothetical protein
VWQPFYKVLYYNGLTYFKIPFIIGTVNTYCLVAINTPFGDIYESTGTTNSGILSVLNNYYSSLQGNLSKVETESGEYPQTNINWIIKNQYSLDNMWFSLINYTRTTLQEAKINYWNNYNNNMISSNYQWVFNGSDQIYPTIPGYTLSKGERNTSPPNYGFNKYIQGGEIIGWWNATIPKGFFSEGMIKTPPKNCNLVIEFNGQANVNSTTPTTKQKFGPSLSPDVKVFCNVGGGVASTGTITPAVLLDLRQKAILLKSNGFDGVSFDIEVLEGYSTATAAATDFEATFKLCKSIGLDVLVTTSYNGYTGALKDSFPNPDATPNPGITFLNYLASSIYIDIYSPQLYSGGATTVYKPASAMGYGAPWGPNYCDWIAGIIAPSISITPTPSSDWSSIIGSTPSAPIAIPSCFKSNNYIVW